jgi:squalene cyclase
MFGTTLCYVGLRLLGGANEDDPACVRGRAFLRQHGGCLYTSSWAKLWLCVLGR